MTDEQQPTKLRRLNWKRDLPDHRDFRFSPKPSLALPKKIDLSANMPGIVDQGDLGSCTGNAWAYALGFEQIRAIKAGKENSTTFGDHKFDPISRLYIYYNERRIENTVNEDSGATIRDGVRAVARWGICREEIWPYAPANSFRKPSATSYNEGKKHLGIVGYKMHQDLNTMRACLAEGYPFVFGVMVYTSFLDDQAAHTGQIPMPGFDEQDEGGHALCAMGYDDAKRVFKVPNSWGTHWGEKGFCYIPYDYLANPDLASDFWTLRKAKVTATEGEDEKSA